MLNFQFLFQTIRSHDAWNSPENSADFPRCYFEISHVDKTKQSFICEVTASHEKDTADTDVMAIYEEVEMVVDLNAKILTT